MVHKQTLFNCHTGLLPYVLDIGKMNPEKQVELYQSLIHTGPRFGYRHVFSLLGFLGFLNVYAMRVNLSVAIVAMVNSTSNSGIANNTNITDGTCPAPITPGNSTSETTGDFDWDEKTQSLVLGCFFYGYVLTQIPGGRAAELFGGKWIFGIGILITSVFTILMLSHLGSFCAKVLIMHI